MAFSQNRQDSLVVQNDSIKPKTGVDTSHAVKDSVIKKKRTPHGAAIRSAIIPGWGQAYNKKYWKIPIVYGALGTTAAIFAYNIKQYREIEFAYKTLVNNDSANFVNVAPGLQDFVKYQATNDLFNARSEVRQNIDYTVLVFLGFWGLNVVDAVVDAHLSNFDVGPDVTMKIKPRFDPFTTRTGLSLVFDLHKGKSQPLAIP